MDTVRFGIIGLHNHYHAYPMADYLKRGIAHAKLVAVSDERENYAESFASRYGIDGSYTDYRRLLDLKDVDAVIVTSYTTAHAEHVRACAEAGKHILLDKPIAASMEDAWGIVADVEKNKVKLMMAYLLRFIPAYRKAKELISEGVIGTPVSAVYSIRVPLGFIKDSPDAKAPGWYADPSRGGRGGFMDHGVHFTDFFRWMFESEAKNVFGRIANLTYKDVPVEDYGIAVMTLESGAICTVESTWHAADWYFPDKCTITGTEGEIEFHYQKSPQLEVAGNRAPYIGRLHFDWKGEDRYEVCYRAIVEDFADCIINDRAPVPDAVDGAKALEMILGAYQSHEQNKAIDLPLRGRGRTQ
jgi:predicted dehydrogenase